MSAIVTKENPQVLEFVKMLDRALASIEKLTYNRKPSLNGENYLTDREVSARLKVSRRTLQDWRTEGKIAYIALKGKCLYAESDIQEMLFKHHVKACK